MHLKYEVWTHKEINLCRFVLATRELCLPPIRGVIFCHLLLLVQADIV